MVKGHDFNIKIVGSEITRENDGLAMSSRNALSINKSLLKAKSAAADGQWSNVLLTKAGRQIDYAEIVDKENLEKVEFINGSPVVLCVVAWFGKVRLIDNMEINFKIDVKN
ncbi:hypothetical protein Ahy_A02g008907 [Arachis hypogaea]|uniref:Pantoate--beta-alanine ligase n=1 Tax=Arachis hypogaea TaxID=3818 RepID=A0A445EFG8_ARAHY|nr:hypothetical protein Ahy_A02g008907 [Arachis hypogaea]